jgi:hypothetical protein
MVGCLAAASKDFDMDCTTLTRAKILRPAYRRWLAVGPMSLARLLLALVAATGCQFKPMPARVDAQLGPPGDARTGAMEAAPSAPPGVINTPVAPNDDAGTGVTASPADAGPGPAGAMDAGDPVPTTEPDVVRCGNGRVEAGETCDPPDQCPRSCSEISCVRQTLVGSPDQCNVRCMEEQITTCTTGDRCCPRAANPMCNVTNDEECSAVCDNGVLEPGENCEPKSECQKRSDGCKDDGDTLRTPTGDVTSCTFVCTERKRPCQGGDRECPMGCVAATDPDCSGCGNGKVEASETCDPPSACRAIECSEVSCARQTLVGRPEECNVRCEEEKITACASGDRCCPRAANSSCNATNDAECSAVCANGTLEPGESCEPRDECQRRANACRDDRDTLRTASGDVASCTFVCTERKRTCQAGDGQCPTGCTPGNDSDCDGCGNGRLEPPETCEPPLECRRRAELCRDDRNTLRNASGNVEQCTFACSERRRPCQDRDGECPTGCTPTSDSDCPGCGNGRLDPGERCDPVADCVARQNACVSDAMADRRRTGVPAACTFRCIEMPRSCGPADGQCPAGCTSDPDCCGNGRVDPGESCDPCNTSCPSDRDTIRTPTGSTASCTFRCTETSRMCGTPDGQCPSGCASDSGDPDCKLADGARCTRSAQCRNSFCVAGICCESACDGLCESCSGTDTGAASGRCLPVKAGTDPASECAAQPAATCGTDGSCDGQRACRNHVRNTVCAAATCSADGTTAIAQRLCDGSGTCFQAIERTCGFGEVCQGTACVSTCGLTGQACCPGDSCKIAGETCGQLVIAGAKVCAPCGNMNELCCPGNTCKGASLFCINTMGGQRCRFCGEKLGDLCCPRDVTPRCRVGGCQSESAASVCRPCGGLRQPCCDTGIQCTEGQCTPVPAGTFHCL